MVPDMHTGRQWRGMRTTAPSYIMRLCGVHLLYWARGDGNMSMLRMLAASTLIHCGDLVACRSMRAQLLIQSVADELPAEQILDEVKIGSAGGQVVALPVMDCYVIEAHLPRIPAVFVGPTAQRTERTLEDPRRLVRVEVRQAVHLPLVKLVRSKRAAKPGQRTLVPA